MTSGDRLKACDRIASDMADWHRVERGMTRQVIIEG